MTETEKRQQKFCSLCFPKDSQVIRIMYGLGELILKQSKNIHSQKRNIKLPSKDQKKSNNNSDIQKFINVIFDLNLERGETCKHLLVVEFLEKRTNLSKYQIGIAFESIYNYYAKRNYEIEILSNQVKYFPKRIVEELNRNKKQIQQHQQKHEPASETKMNNIKMQKQLRNGISTDSKAQNQPIIVMPYYLPHLQQTSVYSYPIWALPLNNTN